MPGTSFREASRIANELVEITGHLDGLDRFQARLGECSRYWAKFLDPVRDALHNRIVSLFTPAPEKDPMALITPKFVTGYDPSEPYNEPGHRHAMNVIRAFEAFTEPFAAQVLLDQIQLLPAARQREIATLIGAA